MCLMDENNPWNLQLEYNQCKLLNKAHFSHTLQNTFKHDAKQIIQ